jgi:hypothetical protein
MTSRFRFRALAVAASLALVACGTSDDAADEPVSTVEESAEPEADAAPETVAEPEPDAAPETVAEPVATEPVATEPVATEPVATEPEATDSDAEDCLVGSWLVTEDEMNGYYDVLETNLSADGPAPTFDITGDVLLSFTPTEYVYTADFELFLEVAGQSGNGVVSGTANGTWSSADGIITTEQVSSDLELMVTVAGITLNGSDFAGGLLDSVPINDAPFDCAGPTLSFQAGVDEKTRHDVALTPA